MFAYGIHGARQLLYTSRKSFNGVAMNQVAELLGAIPLLSIYTDTIFLSKTQLIMINQSNAGRFDPKVFVNCIQDKGVR